MLIDAEYTHGGDIYTNDISLDFSSNVNPFGIPEPVRRAAEEAVAVCTAYPDPRCTELRKKISEYEKVPPEHILCGSGAAELIYSFAYSLPKERPALIVSPTFSEYEAALNAAGIAAEHYMLDEQNGFQPDAGILSLDLSEYCAVFICTPNNPTGVTAGADLLESLAKTGVRLFADMCFLELTDHPEMYAVPELVSSCPNVVILKAFTKSFALPGLRLGYALCSDSSFLEEMSGKAPCWNVSVPAQAAGCAALGCTDLLRDKVRTISSERSRLAEAIASMGVKVYPGEANFLLLYSDSALYKGLLSRDILVRDCSNYRGLKKGHVRIAVRRPEENDRLLSAMKEVLR